MADYKSYLDKLSAEASQNIYSELGGIGSQLADTTVQYAGSGGDVGESLLYGAILGMLGGGLEQYGANYAADQLSLANKILLGGSEAGVDLPTDLKVKSAAYRDAMAKERLDKRNTLIDELNLKNTADLVKHKATSLYDESRIGPKITKEQSALEDLLPGGAGTSMVGRPGALTQAGQTIQELEKQTYDRIIGLPTYTTFSDISENFATLQELSKLDSRPASVGMISSLARIWDPNGVVRPGEYELNAQAQDILNEVVGNWKEVVLGEGKLQPVGKQRILEAAGAKYNEFGKKYIGERDQLYDALELQGGSRAYIPTMGYEPYTPTPVEGAALDTAARMKALGYEKVDGGYKKIGTE